MSQASHWNWKLFGGVLVVIVIVAAILLHLAATVPVGPTLPHFIMIRDLPVYSGDGDRSTRTRRLPMDIASKNVSNDHVIYEGELYLKVQETRRALIMTQYVKTFQWSEERLAQLLLDHPELGAYVE